MRKKMALGLGGFLMVSLFLMANGFQEDAFSLDPVNMLGWTLEEAFAALGVPSEVHSVRGDEPWQDDVVFFYENGFSLFWFQNRVWQIAFSRTYRGELAGLKTGLSPEEVLAAMNRPPAALGENWEVYFLSGYDFPLRLQVYYEDHRAVDFYLYRGDF